MNRARLPGILIRPTIRSTARHRATSQRSRTYAIVRSHTITSYKIAIYAGRMATKFVIMNFLIIILIGLLIAIILTPILIGLSAIPDFTRMPNADIQREELRREGVIAPVSRRQLDILCADEASGCFHYFPFDDSPTMPPPSSVMK